MGFFGGTRIAVASTVYNMAGDEKDRPNFIKNLVVGNILTDRKISMGEAISTAYLNGPGIGLKSLYRWAAQNYDAIGLPGGYAGNTGSVNPENIKPFIPNPDGDNLQIRSLIVGETDIKYWAEQYLLENDPVRLNDNYTVRVSLGVVYEATITFEDLTEVVFNPEGFEPRNQYLYAGYYNVEKDATFMFIYGYESGNILLDSAISARVEITGDFFPVIPVRIDNEFVTDELNPTMANLANRAFKKATRKKLSDVIEKLEDNENLGDIDYAHIVFGIPLNTKDNSARKYIYRFFASLASFQDETSETYEEWKTAQEDYQTKLAAWYIWRESQSPDFTRTPDDGDPATNGDEPPTIPAPLNPSNSINLQNTGPIDINFNTVVRWKNISEEVGVGILDPARKVGDVWMTTEESYAYSYFNQDFRTVKNTSDDTDDYITISWQVSETEWRKLHVYGMRHLNYVYQNNLVETGSAAALDDNETTPFLVPLRKSTLDQMSLKDATQLSTTSVMIVLSSFEEVKIKWYETGFFKLVLVIAVIVTMYFTGGFSAGGLGVLGTNAAVGASIGLTGAAAVLAGTVANAVAAMVITSLITKGASAVFGAKVGAIIGIIAGILAVNGLANMSGGNGFVLNFGEMSTAQAIMKTTSAIGDAYSTIAGINISNTLEETQKLIEDYEDESERISELYAENFGSANAGIDPLEFTDALSSVNGNVESLETFLSRTLMTGSDIAELSLDMVSNFAEISLSTELPG